MSVTRSHQPLPTPNPLALRHLTSLRSVLLPSPGPRLRSRSVCGSWLTPIGFGLRARPLPLLPFHVSCCWGFWDRWLRRSWSAGSSRLLPRCDLRWTRRLHVRCSSPEDVNLSDNAPGRLLAASNARAFDDLSCRPNSRGATTTGIGFRAFLAKRDAQAFAADRVRGRKSFNLGSPGRFALLSTASLCQEALSHAEVAPGASRRRRTGRSTNGLDPGELRRTGVRCVRSAEPELSAIHVHHQDGSGVGARGLDVLRRPTPHASLAPRGAVRQPKAFA